jgi:hypothetical protein
MGCYHPSQDDLDVCITAAATKKNVREIDRHEPADPAGAANLQSLHNSTACSRAVAPSGAARF